jgi:hypothetical protein
MSHKIHAAKLARSAFCAALLTGSAMAVAQEIPVTEPPVVAPIPEVPTPPVVPPVDVPEPAPVAPIASPADTVAPEALQSVATEKSAARQAPAKAVAVAPRKPVVNAVAPQPAVVPEANALEAPVTAIPPAATALPEAIPVAPVGENITSLPADEGSNDWLLAAAGLGVLGAAGGVGLVATRRRKRKGEAQTARVGVHPAAPAPMIKSTVAERPITVPQPVVIATPAPYIAPAVMPPISHPAPTASTDPLFTAPVPNIPVTDPLFAAKVVIPPITDPMFADNPDYVGNRVGSRQTYRGFAQNPSPSWAEPRRSTAPKREHEYVN